ncbi:Cytoplasmic FMR1-interacting protein 1 [Mactra antiquata]
MAPSIERGKSEEIRKLIKSVTGFEEYEENFDICHQFVVSNLKYHKFLSVDSHKVTRQLEGVYEKLKIHSEETKAQKLKEYTDEFLDSPVFEGRKVGKTDTHYAILSFLLLIANNPSRSDYVEKEKVKIPEVKVDFDWGAYLREGIEIYEPSDEELSDWSNDDDDDDDDDDDGGGGGNGDNDVSAAIHQQQHDHSSTGSENNQQNMVPYIISESSSLHIEETNYTEDYDWLSEHLIGQYWRGESLNIDVGRYRSSQLNKDWENYKERSDPLYGSKEMIVVSENILLREVIWMLMGVSNLYLIDFNGKFYVPKSNVVVTHLSEESLKSCLSYFTRYGAYVLILQNFVEDCYHGNSSNYCQTYQSFATCVADFLQKMRKELHTIENKLIKQEKVLTLLSVASDIQPLMQKVSLICLIYMRGVHQGRQFKLQSQKVTQLLTTLYSMLLCYDTLLESSVVMETGLTVQLDQSMDSAEMLRIVLPIWIQTCRPYINIIDTWISHGYLTDSYGEFVIQRNKDVHTLDETFWEKSFTSYALNKEPDKSKDKEGDSRSREYQTLDWAPKFLQPILQHIVLTGKSMEMLEELGKLAEDDGKGFSDLLKKFKETHLYDKFISSLHILLGTKEKENENSREATSSSSSGETTTSQSRIFSPETVLQMKGKGIHDSFLKIHFENLMKVDSEKHTILERDFINNMETLDLDNLQPIELILQECLYPHIYKQYEQVCQKLVNTMKSEYHLLDYLTAIRKFFLMEAGDTMFIFYTEIFDKIRLHEHWKDSGTVTWALHEALDRHYPDEVMKISAYIDTQGEETDSQPINVTNCIRLKYEIPCPIDVVINARCQEIYNDIFSFLLQVKRAKYCLDELRFYDLAKKSTPSTTEHLLRKLNIDNTPRLSKIHKMHLLRMRLINFINSLHNYIMFRILHSIGLEFTQDLKEAKDLDQVIEVHSGYIHKIHERCLLHRRNASLKQAVLKVLNLALRFQKEWDLGIDNISIKQIVETETEFSRCIKFLRSFLNTVIQRGSFPHLESLAFGLDNLCEGS